MSGGRKVDGKKPTQWVKAVIFGKQAEALAPYLLKGQMMHFSETLCRKLITEHSLDFPASQ